MGTTNKEKLLSMKKKIEGASAELSKLEGKQSSIMEQLEDQFNCKTIKQANALLEQTQKDIADLDKQIQKGVDALEQDYDFDIDEDDDEDDED